MEQKSTAPLYQMICDNLKARIKAGDFRYDSPFCTEKSLCEEYGVSRITAKRAIEDLEREGILWRKRGVGSFVLSLEEQDDYQIPSPPLDEQLPHRTIALIIPFNISQGGSFKTVKSATTMLAGSHCYLTLHVYESGSENERTILETLYAGSVDGVIYYPSSANLPTEILDRFYASERPVIILDKPHEYPRYSSIICDNLNGGYLLTEHLIAYGHRDIVYLSRFSTEEVSSIRDRYNGYCRCLQDSDIQVEPRFIHVATPHGENLDYPMLKHIINSLYRDGVTAVECENDEVAFFVYMCCIDLSIRIPEDLSVTGFDNISWATNGGAQITTVEQDFEQIGGAIAELVLKPYSPLHRVIPVRLVPRSSTGSAKK